MQVLHNNNGMDYTILELCEFKGADVDYYKNSWQKYRFGLLKNESGNFVVASMVGDTEWGNGHYFGKNKEDEKFAREYYADLCKEYNKK